MEQPESSGNAHQHHFTEEEEEAQQEELVVLASMYPEEFQPQGDGTSFTIGIQPSIDGVVVPISPLIFQWTKTVGYPFKNMVHFQLSADWMTSSTHMEKVTQKLKDLYEEQNPRGVILFTWVEWLKSDVIQFIGVEGDVMESIKEAERKIKDASKQTKAEEEAKSRAKEEKKEQQMKAKKLQKVFGHLVDSANVFRIFQESQFDLNKAVEQLCKMTGMETQQVLQKLQLIPQEEEEGDISPVSMRTSEDVFNRIQWDESCNPDEFIIGYTDRFEGLQEIEYTMWESRNVTEETFIPWHRVQYFKQNNEIVWDRRNKVDKVFGSV